MAIRTHRFQLRNELPVAVALVHDWITGVGGADRVLKALHELFPSAPIYTLFHDAEFTRGFLPNADIRPSKLQGVYARWKRPSIFWHMLPSGIESFDMSEYDLVISSSVAYAKGLILKPSTLHICYCYSPARQLWDWSNEHRESMHGIKKAAAEVAQHVLRIWDRHASSRVEHFVAISEHVRSRIKKYYKEDARVIYPPVNVSSAMPETYGRNRDGYFLIVSRLFKHKNIEIAVRAFNKLGWPLIIVGNGPDGQRLKSLAYSNVRLIAYQTDDAIAEYYSRCEAFVMPQEEDFGIAPIEAMACGKPVIALRRGGALEYIEEGVNGVFFDDPFEGSLAHAARIMKERLSMFNPQIIRQSAARFSKERFMGEMRSFVVEKLHEHGYVS